MLGQSNFSLFTIRIIRDRFDFERTRASAYGYPVSETGENAGELPRKFISFQGLENESIELGMSNTGGTETYPNIPGGANQKLLVLKKPRFLRENV